MVWLLNDTQNSHPERPQWEPCSRDYAARMGMQATPEWQRRFDEACAALDDRERMPDYVNCVFTIDGIQKEYRRLKAKKDEDCDKERDKDRVMAIENKFYEAANRLRIKTSHWDNKLYRLEYHSPERDKRHRLISNLNRQRPTFQEIDAIDAIEAEDAAKELERERQAGRPRKNSVTEVVEPIGDGPGPDKWANYYALQALREREAVPSAVGPMPPLQFKSQKSLPVSIPPHMAHGDEWEKATNRQAKHYKR